jgi:hypothetical protein
VIPDQRVMQPTKVVVDKDQNQGSSNLGELEGKGKEKEDERSYEMNVGKAPEYVFCHRCKVVGHYTKECRRVWQGDRDDVFKDQDLSECVASLRATQVEGMAFICIPNMPSQNHAKERANTVIVTVLKGSITAKQLEEEFTRIQSGV